MRTYLVLLALLGYIFSYPICELFFSENIEAWYTLKYTLFSAIVGMLVLSNKVDDETLSEGKKTNFVLNVYIGVLISDIIDRTFFTTDFQWTDWVLLGLNILINIGLEIKNGNCKNLNNLYGSDKFNTS